MSPKLEAVRWRASPPHSLQLREENLLVLHDPRLNLLVGVERNIVQSAGVLAGGAGAFPAAERLEARPGAGGGALRPVGVGDAGLDLVEEDVGFLLGAVEP